MKLTLSAVLLLLLAADSRAADPVYLDVMMETPSSTLQAQFPKLRREGCYRLPDGRFLLIALDKKDSKPWRIAVAQDLPCKRAEDGPSLDVQHRSGVLLGDSTPAVVEKLGRPDAAAQPEASLKKLGEMEYFYICRVSEGCARHTSVFITGGKVTGIAEWYSE